MTAPTQLCSFRLAGMTFGLPAIEVQEIIRLPAITRVPLADRAVAGLVNLRGQIVTAIDLRARLGLPSRHVGERSIGVVIRTEDGVFGLLVDEIGDVLDLDHDSLHPIPETVSAGVRDALHGAFQLAERGLVLLLISDHIVRTDVPGVSP